MIRQIDLKVPVQHAEITLAETMLLVGLASGQQAIGTSALEFGTLYGTATTNIARALPNHKVLTCSLGEGETPMLAYGEEEHTLYKGVKALFPEDVRDRITHFQCDSAKLTLPVGCQLGFVFVDGGHSYEYVRSDFITAKPLLVYNALVVFHDYGEDGKGGISGVKKAVDEIVAAHRRWEWSKVGTMVWGRVRL